MERLKDSHITIKRNSVVACEAWISRQKERLLAYLEFSWRWGEGQ